MRIWKCYGIGQGKCIPYDKIYIKHKGQTELQTSKSQGFYDPPEKREVKRLLKASKVTKAKTQLFECSFFGCVEAFGTFEQLQLHLDVGKHNIRGMNQYDEIKRDWALTFSSIDSANAKRSYLSDVKEKQTSHQNTVASSLQKGWALSKPRSNVRFSQKVKLPYRKVRSWRKKWKESRPYTSCIRYAKCQK